MRFLSKFIFPFVVLTSVSVSAANFELLENITLANGKIISVNRLNTDVGNKDIAIMDTNNKGSIVVAVCKRKLLLKSFDMDARRFATEHKCIVKLYIDESEEILSLPETEKYKYHQIAEVKINDNNQLVVLAESSNSSKSLAKGKSAILLSRDNDGSWQVISEVKTDVNQSWYPARDIEIFNDGTVAWTPLVDGDGVTPTDRRDYFHSNGEHYVGSFNRIKDDFGLGFHEKMRRNTLEKTNYHYPSGGRWLNGAIRVINKKELNEDFTWRREMIKRGETFFVVSEDPQFIKEDSTSEDTLARYRFETPATYQLFEIVDSNSPAEPVSNKGLNPISNVLKNSIGETFWSEKVQYQEMDNGYWKELQNVIRKDTSGSIEKIVGPVALNHVSPYHMVEDTLVIPIDSSSDGRINAGDDLLHQIKNDFNEVFALHELKNYTQSASILVVKPNSAAETIVTPWLRGEYDFGLGEESKSAFSKDGTALYHLKGQWLDKAENTAYKLLTLVDFDSGESLLVPALDNMVGLNTKFFSEQHSLGTNHYFELQEVELNRNEETVPKGMRAIYSVQIELPLENCATEFEEVNPTYCDIQEPDTSVSHLPDSLEQYRDAIRLKVTKSKNNKAKFSDGIELTLEQLTNTRSRVNNANVVSNEMGQIKWRAEIKKNKYRFVAVEKDLSPLLEVEKIDNAVLFNTGLLTIKEVGKKNQRKNHFEWIDFEGNKSLWTVESGYQAIIENLEPQLINEAEGDSIKFGADVFINANGQNISAFDVNHRAIGQSPFFGVELVNKAFDTGSIVSPFKSNTVSQNGERFASLASAYKYPYYRDDIILKDVQLSSPISTTKLQTNHTANKDIVDGVANSSYAVYLSRYGILDAVYRLSVDGILESISQDFFSGKVALNEVGDIAYEYDSGIKIRLNDGSEHFIKDISAQFQLYEIYDNGLIFFRTKPVSELMSQFISSRVGKILPPSYPFRESDLMVYNAHTGETVSFDLPFGNVVPGKNFYNGHFVFGSATIYTTRNGKKRLEANEVFRLKIE